MMDQSEFRTILKENFFSWAKTISSSMRPSNRTNRNEGKRDGEIALTHWLSGYVVKGLIENGNYSKKEMGKIQNELEEVIRKEMTFLLFKHYNVKGISNEKNYDKSKYKINIEKIILATCLNMTKYGKFSDEDIKKYYK